MQCLYPPAEAGPAGQLTALALKVTRLPGHTIRGFTIRLKHSSLEGYAAETPEWEPGGWTLVYQEDLTLSKTGWLWLVFQNPFDYDGTRSLMVDFSFNGDSFSSDGLVSTSVTTGLRTLALYSDSTLGEPGSWTGSYPEGSLYQAVPSLQLRRAGVPFPLEPETAGPFVHASWRGYLSLPEEAAEVRLTVTDPADASIFGSSPPLKVVVVEDFALNALPAFSGGTTRSLAGEALPAGHDYEFQRATLADFSNAVSSGFVSAPAHSFTGLTDGVLYHYRARSRRQGARGRWSPVIQSTQDTTAPALVFNPSSGGITGRSSLILGGSASDAVSGLAGLTVNGIAIAPAAFSHWTLPTLPLEEGLNSIAYTASDNAVPPNVRSGVWTVTRLTDPHADEDGNGIASFLNYAFHAHGSAESPLPTLVLDRHPTTGKKHLLVTYRRLLEHPESLVYTLEASTGLDGWEALGGSLELVSAHPTGDGMTELATFRIHPAVDGSTRRFVRLRVESTAE